MITNIEIKGQRSKRFHCYINNIPSGFNLVHFLRQVHVKRDENNEIFWNSFPAIIANFDIESQICILYSVSLNTGKYSPPFYFRPFHPPCIGANLRLIELHWLKLSLFKNNLLWANSRQDETVCKWKGVKIMRKISLFTVIFGWVYYMYYFIIIAIFRR